VGERRAKKDKKSRISEVRNSVQVPLSLENQQLIKHKQPDLDFKSRTTSLDEPSTVFNTQGTSGGLSDQFDQIKGT